MSHTYLPVLGIGTVEIPTKRSPNRSGVSSYSSLRLKEVLHVPGFICNVIGGHIESSDGYHLDTCGSPKSNGTIRDRRGKHLAYFDPKRPLFSIRVKNQPGGPKFGPHVLQKGILYMLSCEWESTEQQRWLDYQRQGGMNDHTSKSACSINTNPPYTAAEKGFLKAAWRDEYHFLLQHGLKISNDEDRAEGRLILRALLHEDDSDQEFLGEESDNAFEDEELDLLGHQADYNFSDKQLDWIETHYGNSESFMLSYGLKFYSSEDVEEAKAIANAMMFS